MTKALESGIAISVDGSTEFVGNSSAGWLFSWCLSNVVSEGSDEALVIPNSELGLGGSLSIKLIN